MIKREILNPNEFELEDTMVSLTRVTKVVKGGKNMGFRAVIVVGNQDGVVGMGIGKANEVPEAIRKGIEKARKNLIRVCRHGDTIPHEVYGIHGAAKVILKPASPGTGIIAGGAARAVMHACGVRNCFAKSLGSSNAMNVVKATLSGLQKLYDEKKVAAARGKTVEDIMWAHRQKEKVSAEPAAAPGAESL